MLIAIAVIAVVAIAAVAAFMLLNNNGGNKEDNTDTSEYLTDDSGKATISSVNTKLLVFGNANNDVYLNNDDVTFIQNIVDGKSTWNKTKNPLADTNADGKITKEDVSLLKCFIAGKSAPMFYVNDLLETVKITFPLTGKIAIGGAMDADLLKIIGKYDLITATLDGDYDESVYSGASKWTRLGSYPFDYEKVVASGATVVMGQGGYVYDATFDDKVKAGYPSFPIDQIKLHEARWINGIEGIASTITLGALFGSFDNSQYKAYLDYMNNINTILDKATSGISAGDEKSYILLTSHSCNSPSDLGIDTMSTGLENYADVATVVNLKMTNAYPIGPEGYITGLSVENILKYDPDVLFVEAVSVNTYEDYVATVSKIAGWFTSAGYDGKIIGKYDLIAATLDGDYDESVYPGASKWTRLGSYPFDYEKVVASGATVVMGQGGYVYDATFDQKVKSGYSSFPIDQIKLHEARWINGIEGIASTITIGALFGSFDNEQYQKYLDYMDNINNILDKATSSISSGNEMSYILLTSHSCNSPSDLGIDTMSTGLENYADVATVVNLKMTNAYPIGPEGYITGLSVENILKYDPDVLFVEAVSVNNYDDYVATVNKIAAWFTSAGYDGKIIGTSFNVMGGASSIALLPILSTYVYGTADYSESSAWRDLVYYYNTFLGEDYTVESIKKTIIAPFIVTTSTQSVDDPFSCLTANSGKATVSSVNTKLLVFGNANNDVFLDESDIRLVQSYVDGKATWDKTKNPLADTNADGKITPEDVDLLRCFLNRDTAPMFYVNDLLETVKITFPLTGKIAIGGAMDADLLKILGKYDLIAATLDGDYDESVYPGASKWTRLGSYPFDYEKVVASGATVVMGQGGYVYDATFDQKVKSGYSSFPIDQIKLHEARWINGIEGIAATITIGALMNCFDNEKYQQYLDYMDNINEILNKATAGISAGEEKSYILLTSHSCNSPSDLGMDTMSTGLENYADVATVVNLKMTNAYPLGSEGYITGLSVENILRYDPDVIFVEAVSVNTYEDYIATVNKIAGWFRSAGYDGQIIGVSFSVIGGASSISLLPILSTYVYGTDSYSEESAWEDLVYYYNNFLGGNYTVDSIKKTINAPFIVA